jgi:glyoxylase-like metal-dependent hydrolase (beta-lactamase superfamily II)
MARLEDRNPRSAPGDWYIDERCIDCTASREVAPGLIVKRGGKSVFAHQPQTEEEERAAWRAVLVCPTASVGTQSHRPQPPDLFPQELAPGVFRCGYNASASFGAQSYFVRRDAGNLLIDAPRFVRPLVHKLEALGGIGDILLTHRDDVADAQRYAEHFRTRVWIHREDRAAAPYASNLLEGGEATTIRGGLLAVPLPGHTLGSVAFLLEECYLFTGDSMAWSREREELQAFHDACWHSWTELRLSLTRLAEYRFEWVLPGHGESVHLSAEKMQEHLRALVQRM